MQHQTTIGELASLNGLFTTVDHITVPETDPSTGITEEVTLPPPLIRRKTLRGDTVVFVLTPPGIHERIHVTDGALVTIYYRDTTPAAPAMPAPPAARDVSAAPHQAAAPWPQPVAPQQPAPQRRPAAPWQS
ncbi:hypothetical protein [Streptomyces sp. NPDC048272]|uniref:hypothetical protein n=1 Tax=Streptomyces sp. NPDC048272 TaxID=3154616 RepID=UPI00342A43D5